MGKLKGEKMKKWIQSFSDEHCIASVSRFDWFGPSIDLFKFLSAIEKIEKEYGTIRNVTVSWQHIPESGSGADREPEHFDYRIRFERLESDEEVEYRERYEEKERLKREKEEAQKQKEEMALFKKLYAKYGEPK